MSTNSTILTDQQKNQYRESGYCVLTGTLTGALLELLQAEAEEACRLVDAEMDAAHTDVLGGSRRGSQYTPGNCRDRQPALCKFLFSDLMAEVTQSLLDDQTALLWEQFSIKLAASAAGIGFNTDGNPQSQGKFSWHQDSGYVPFAHEPYVTCWIALDDVTIEKGAVRVLPFDEIGVRTRVHHIPDASNGDLVGYFGTSEGVPVELSAGSMVCFSSALFHCSGRNETEEPRRGYIAQYGSLAAIRNEPWPTFSPFSV